MPTPTTNFGFTVPDGTDPAQVAADMGVFLGQIDSSLGNAWTSYTPAWTAATANPAIVDGTIVGRYKLLGKWGICNGQITMGASTTYGTGAYRFGLPSGWTMLNTPAIAMRGAGGAYDLNTTTNYAGEMTYVTATTVTMRTHAAASPIAPTVPFTFAVGDVISWELLVELV